MGRQAATALYVLVMATVVVVVDILFFKHDFLPRLLTNVGIVLVFLTVFVLFVKHRLN